MGNPFWLFEFEYVKSAPVSSAGAFYLFSEGKIRTAEGTSKTGVIAVRRTFLC
ncbi:hypothetical protein [Pseudomonas mandelii]|uniref:hypothetical protein n=1 Tax=Pseudomonas mandelii TaxID=75612 RepID=UPI00209DAC6A|nr:hypothetical protein [Pseudomonas mandelii]MCO8310938.1 hypothetical protein [Pseudomonas mandelii]